MHHTKTTSKKRVLIIIITAIMTFTGAVGANAASEKNYIPASRYNNEHQLRTLYNIVPTEKAMESAKRYNMLCSNDADFHRNLLDCESDVVVMMAKLAYEYFFKSKKYISLPVENIDVPLIHAAIYRNDVDNYIREFADMIRQEMESKIFEIHTQ